MAEAGKRLGNHGNLGGKRPGAGRKKGTPNKITSDVKAAIIEAFENAGGAEYLTELAKTNPSVFCVLLGKLIPPQTPEGAIAAGGLIWMFPNAPSSTE
jgi:hypothetical protein